MFWAAGVDSSDRWHDIYVQDEAAQGEQRFRIPNAAEGFEELDRRLAALTPDRTAIRIGIEQPHGPLTLFLVRRGYGVYPLNPRVVKRARDRFGISGAKSDPQDGRVISEVIRTDSHRLRPLQRGTELFEELRLWVEATDRLIVQQTRLLNELTACLKEYYPVAVGLFSDLDSSIALAFLERFPDYASLKGLDEKAWQDFLTEHRYPALHRNRAADLLATLRQRPWPVEDVVAKVKRQEMLARVAQIRLLKAQIAEFDQRVRDTFEKHEDSAIFDSVPGAGERLAPRLLVIFGEDRSRFPTPGRAQAFFGTAPITIQSGKHREVTMRRACNKRARQVLQQHALTSKASSAWARLYYQKHRADGKRNSMALRALANRWVEILWALWTRKERYDEAKHMNNLASMKVLRFAPDGGRPGPQKVGVAISLT